MPDDNFDDIFSPQLTRADVRDEASKLLRDIATFNAQAVAGQQAAVREMNAVHADFESRRPAMLRVLEQIPLLKDAVASAEANPQLSSALPQMYEVVYRASQASTEGNTAAPASERSSVESQSGSETDLSSEDVQYSAALASRRVNLSPENRKSIISDLEAKGVLDIEF